MLSAIKNFFDKNISSEIESDIDHQLKLATAALMIEMMHQDIHVKDEEINAVKTALREKFDITDDECQTLFKLAEEEVKEAVDFHQFTHLIASEFSQPQKIRVIELLWSVAYADLHLDSLEEHMVRKIADLIYVSHKDFLQAKHRIQNKLNTGS